VNADLEPGETGYIHPTCLMQEVGGEPKLRQGTYFSVSRERRGEGALKVYLNPETLVYECELPPEGTPIHLYILEAVKSAKVVLINAAGNRFDRVPHGRHPSL